MSPCCHRRLSTVMCCASVQFCLAGLHFHGQNFDEEFALQPPRSAVTPGRFPAAATDSRSLPSVTIAKISVRGRLLERRGCMLGQSVGGLESSRHSAGQVARRHARSRTNSKVVLVPRNDACSAGDIVLWGLRGRYASAGRACRRRFDPTHSARAGGVAWSELQPNATACSGRRIRGGGPGGDGGTITAPPTRSPCLWPTCATRSMPP